MNGKQEITPTLLREKRSEKQDELDKAKLESIDESLNTLVVMLDIEQLDASLMFILEIDTVQTAMDTEVINDSIGPVYLPLFKNLF